MVAPRRRQLPRWLTREAGRDDGDRAGGSAATHRPGPAAEAPVAAEPGGASDSEQSGPRSDALLDPLDRFVVPADSEPSPSVGRPPENRRQTVIKLLWMCLWMAYLGAPVSDLLVGGHGPVAIVLGSLGLAAYLATYVTLVFVRPRRVRRGAFHVALLGLLVLAAALSFALGPPWLVLFVYLSVASGAVLPTRQGRLMMCLATSVLVLVGLPTDRSDDLWPSLIIPSLLGGFAMSGLQQMIRTTKELREARAAVAHLAANEERLRLARDLHDLLGHSLSLITLKSELAGRMLPGDPEAAATQIADIEQVSRQALVDVREAVSDYRRPTLKVEIASASTALTAAGIQAELPGPTAPSAPAVPSGVHVEQESALAWALREGTTNVIRHSGATRCTVTLTEQADDTMCLTITDNGRGPAEQAAPRGNGLSGLAERLALADGSLETGAGVRGGFRLCATVPMTPRSPDRVAEQPRTPRPTR